MNQEQAKCLIGISISCLFFLSLAFIFGPDVYVFLDYNFQATDYEKMNEHLSTIDWEDLHAAEPL